MTYLVLYLIAQMSLLDEDQQVLLHHVLRPHERGRMPLARQVGKDVVFVFWPEDELQIVLIGVHRKFVEGGF